MRAFFSWLAREPKGKEHARFLLRVTIGCFLYVVCVFFFFRTLFGGLPGGTQVESLLRRDLFAIVGILFISCAVEELFFRWPLALFLEKSARPMFVLLAALLSSVIFGYAHGGWINIFIQGVFGFVLSLVFIKCGGNSKNFWKALGSSFAVHYAYDLIVFLPYFVSKPT